MTKKEDLLRRKLEQTCSAERQNVHINLKSVSKYFSYSNTILNQQNGINEGPLHMLTIANIRI